VVDAGVAVTAVPESARVRYRIKLATSEDKRTRRKSFFSLKFQPPVLRVVRGGEVAAVDFATGFNT
jgi:hypothetical protein